MTNPNKDQLFDGARSNCPQCTANCDGPSMPPGANSRTPDHERRFNPFVYDERVEEAFEYRRDATPIWDDNCARFLIGQTEYWLSPTPLNLEGSLTLVMNTMVGLHYQREEWLPLLLNSAEPIKYAWDGESECEIRFSPNREVRHIGVEYREKTLIISFPPFERWKDVSLAWMIDDGCPCGYADCHPAPWRGTPCPFRKW